MALPSLAKSYQFKVNQAFPALGTALADNRALLLGIRDGLKGVGSWTDGAGSPFSPTNVWTTRYSCDSVAAGSAGDGVDRWVSASNLVWNNAGSAHSWYVLRQTAIATNYELLISLEGAAANGVLITVVVSPSAAFTGGTTTARPTATDEIVLLNNAQWNNLTGDLSAVLHVESSTDGQVTRVWIYQNNVVVAFWAFEKPQLPVSSWSNPSIAMILGNVAPTLANINSAANWNAKGVSTMALYGTVESIGTGPLPSQMPAPNDISGNWPFFGMGLFSLTAANRGRHGNPFDLWWGLTAANEADGYPSGAPVKQFVQVGDLILPWNRSTALTA